MFYFSIDSKIRFYNIYDIYYKTLNNFLFLKNLNYIIKY